MSKAKVIVTLQKNVSDPQGQTIHRALNHLGYDKVKGVRVGKYFEIELDAPNNEDMKKQIEEMSHRLLSNPVIEDGKCEMEA